jgi:RNA polymerase-binding transcription factor DksA
MSTDIYKEKLEKELALVESELNKVARRNPEHPDIWEPLEDEDVDRIDDDSVANDLENFAENTSLTKDLQVQYANIQAALEKIHAGTYGICEIGGESIPQERLEVEPSARNCVEHSK